MHVFTAKNLVESVLDRTLDRAFVLKITTITVTLLVGMLSSTVSLAKTDKPLQTTTFLGLTLIDSTAQDVREHFGEVGGFLQADSTVRQLSYDKFYPWSTIRDSYYVEFEYNNAGNIVKAKRLYRPHSLINNNRRTDIETIDIAKQLIKQLGNPSSVEVKGWGGGLRYRSFRWEDDFMEIIVDREGSERLGNVFVEYRIKIQDRFAVEKDDQKGNNA